MPELPEAETIARGLRDALTGCSLGRTRIHHADVVEGDPRALAPALAGARVEEVGRRGKNVVLRLSREGGDLRPADLRLVVNLGMSGRLLHRGPSDDAPPPTHPAVEVEVHAPGGGGGGTLVYHDPRRFGRLRVLDAGAWRAWSRTLGPEPLGRTWRARDLQAALARSVSPIRSWLLDQRRVAGVGNIYANEALFLAGIHPMTPAAAIPPAAGARLHRAIRRVLRDAVAAQGTTLRDYRTAQGWEGSYGAALRVYGREGEPCPRCRTPVERLVFGNRSAFLCPRCQPDTSA
jgi:formamidopyrimidine-DNA glycosylase